MDSMIVKALNTPNAKLVNNRSCTNPADLGSFFLGLTNSRGGLYVYFLNSHVLHY